MDQICCLNCTEMAEVHRDPALNADRAHQHPHPNASNSDAETTVDHLHISQPSPAPYEKDGFPAALDVEKGSNRSKEVPESTGRPRWMFSAFYRKYKIFFHIFFFVFFTGWWIAGLVLNHTIVKVGLMIPPKWRIPGAAMIVIAAFLVGTFATEESPGNTRDNRAVSLFGLLVFIGVLWATSRNRKVIQWHTVIVGMLLQYIIALFVLRTGVGFDIFQFISGLARSLLGFAGKGTAFLTSDTTAALPWFLITVLPAIIFFVAFAQMLYHFGFIQWFIGKFAVFFFWAMKVSGAEAVVAAASPFIGQGESAMLIRPFIPHLTQAELHQVMCSGFATIAGSVLIAYIGMGVNPQALISSCVMSIPASLAVSKLRYPEEEESLTAGRVVIPDDDEHKSVNALHALTNGAWLGLKIAGMIASTLLCVLALLGLANGLLRWWGTYLNISNLSIEMIFGYLCYPIAFLLGVPRMLIVNEFVAYDMLQRDAEYADISPRSRPSLPMRFVAPSRSADVSRLAISALLSGALSTLTSASVAGLIVTDNVMKFVKPTSA
ncbi:Na+ dependent nucleoside transporter C-terminus-domain-containing protein [Terfezia claveryi]|nr:Na+ dependent nucleoside transporter C-terminus-domain-containing protein [Terfezia claveryi]